MACVFCRIVEGSAPSYPVYQDEHAFAFLDRAAVAPGHTLVVPRRHTADIWSIDRAEAGRLMETVHDVARLLGERLSPDGMTISQANRAAGGQGVLHLHVHLLPRYTGDGLLARWRPTHPTDADLKAMWVRLR
jgi:histidine triad (HIT) family protein